MSEVIAKRSTAADCKSVSFSLIGSNPIYFILILKKKIFDYNKYLIANKNLYKIKTFFIIVLFESNVYTPSTVNTYCATVIFFSFIKLLYLKWKKTFRENWLQKSVTNTIIKLNFRGNILYVSVLVNFSWLLFNLRPGLYQALLTRFKKNFKRTKIAKFILIRHLRKILLVLRLLKFDVLINRLPLYLRSLLNTLVNPLIKQFIHPYTYKIIEDFTLQTNSIFTIAAIYLIHLNTANSTKTKRLRRLKRKITRRLLMRNKPAF